MLVLSAEKLEALGQALLSKFNIFATEREQLEKQWLRNLRQYKAQYDPEVKIPDGHSKVYPKDTHTKITGWVAKIMEMMFPAQEKNYSIQTTPFPNIAEADLNIIINNLNLQQQQLQQQSVLAAQQAGQPPTPVPPVSAAMIEKAVKEFADARAKEMEKECDDQLADNSIDYPDLCKKVVRRAGIYGFGVAEGPQVRTQTERVWMPDPETGNFVAQSKKVKKPFYTVLKSWDTYPDLSAQLWADQEGIFTRKAVSRQGLRVLAKRDEYFGSVISEYLSEHTTGDYKPRAYEAELDVIRNATMAQSTTSMRQYEVLRWYGYVSAQVLHDIGVPSVPASALDKDILADVWLLGGKVIKADTAPFGEKVSDMFHVFIPEEDEDGPLTGSSKVELLRDSQLKLAAVDRAIMDNMADSASSIKEVNDDLIDTSKRPAVIHGGITIHRSGENEVANYPAVRIYDIPNHTAPLLNLRDNILRVFDTESNLPAWRMGDTQPLGEAFRTSNNMSIMAGGGDMVTKDDVRSFDKFVSSFIGSLVQWNMEFNEKPEIKGDFQVQPKGNFSLVAKEVRGAALDQLSQTLTPRDRVQMDDRKLLIDRLKSRDLPTDYLLPEDEAKQALAAYDQQQSQAAQVQQGLTTSKTQSQMADAQLKTAKAQEVSSTLATKVQESLSKIAANLAKAKGVKDGTALQQIKLLLDEVKAESTPGGAAATTSQDTSAEQ